MKWIVTGDTHGNVCPRLMQLDMAGCIPSETSVVILGDAGINFYLNSSDRRNKKRICETGYTIYCVRGNHEERPENLGIEKYWDENVNNNVYMEPEFPNIRYFIDGEIYKIKQYRVLILGGAYSVDKWYRLSQFDKESKWTGWFKDEQLSPEEMSDIEYRCTGEWFDFVFSHTCPESWQPFDLFLDDFDQSTIDKSMEQWLEKMRHLINYQVWLFGHFHDDRLVRPGVEMYYDDYEDLDDIYERWTKYKDLPKYLKKDPNYFIETD